MKSQRIYFLAGSILVIAIFWLQCLQSETNTLSALPPTAIPCDILLEKIFLVHQDYEESFINGHPLIPDRDNYSSSVVEQDQLDFCKIYQTALQAQKEWVNDPIEIAMRFTGAVRNPESLHPDNIAPIQLFMSYRNYNPRMMSLILTTEGTGDSVLRKEERVDMAYIDEMWVIQWYGYRLKCKRNALGKWIKNPCQ